MATLTRKLILVGAYAGKDITLSTGKLSAIKVIFKKGEAVIQGSEKDVEGICTYMRKCYQAYPEGTLELTQAQERCGQHGTSDIQKSPEQGNPSQVPNGVQSSGSESPQVFGSDRGSTDESHTGQAGSIPGGDGHQNTGVSSQEERREQETLYKGIMSLDAMNDDQWTAQGLPKVDVLEGLVGPFATRKNINAVCPDYTREKALDLQAAASAGAGAST